MYRIVRHDLNNETRRVMYESSDPDDVQRHLDNNYPRAHAENGRPVEQFVVESDDEPETQEDAEEL